MGCVPSKSDIKKEARSLQREKKASASSLSISRPTPLQQDTNRLRPPSLSQQHLHPPSIRITPPPSPTTLTFQDDSKRVGTGTRRVRGRSGAKAQHSVRNSWFFLSVLGSADNGQQNEELQKMEILANKEVKMLLLGAGESGKSTVMKQLKMMHHGSYTDHERDSYREIILSNIVQSMRAVLLALPGLNIQLEPPNLSLHDIIVSLPTTQPEGYMNSLERKVVFAVKSLWRDPGVRHAVLYRSNEFALNDSAVYLFNSLDRLTSADYMPTDQDVLRARVQSTSITEASFHVRDMTYKVFDVSGGRTERQRWKACFQQVSTVVFVVAVSEYDRVREDGRANRIQEAITLFDSIRNSRWFLNTSIILFLNKMDLFAEKLVRSPLSDFFPDYDGEPTDYLAASEYLLYRFVESTQDSQTPKQIYAHYTCATEADQMKTVLGSVQDVLIQQHLFECSML